VSNVLLTFDYELFFGSNSGTQEKCIIEPTHKIVKLLNKYNIKATFFVDSGYILKLQVYKDRYPEIEKDYKRVVSQIETLNTEGHEIQLHIHPHWEDSYYNGQKWTIDTNRYRLHDFSKDEVDDIVYRYKKVMTDIVGDNIFAYRAGGWSIQPFSHLKDALKKHHIWMDSTVFENGKNSSATHYFDFKNTPNRTEWRFEDDPTEEESNGFFKEIPISAYRLSPLFFWKLVYFKKFGGIKHKNFGDGSATGGSKLDKLRMLTQYTNSVVSMDGYKISFLEKAYQNFLKKRDSMNFVVIAHPKAMSEYSLEKLEAFIRNSIQKNFITYKEI
jgi:peptidoglycan/xylan/chitin deacetylase (PgdA/CDA1 family)